MLTDKATHASRLFRSSQNLSQKVDLFLIRSTLVLRVRGSVPPLLDAATPVAMLCSDAELFVMNDEPPPPPSPSDWDPERCISIALLLLYVTQSAIVRANWPISRYTVTRLLSTSTPFEIFYVLHNSHLNCLQGLALIQRGSFRRNASLNIRHNN